MASMDARQPPRFVPTLTDVVPLPAQDSEPRAQAVLPSSHELDVSGESVRHTPRGASNEEPQEVLPTSEMMAAGLAESLQLRVMQRLDEALEERLRYALADMVQLHAQQLFQAIRADVERLVHISVQEAVAQEMVQAKQDAAP